MAVSLQEFVAIFIAALYNLCKTYLGNRPFILDVSSKTKPVLLNAEFQLARRIFIIIQGQDYGSF